MATKATKAPKVLVKTKGKEIDELKEIDKAIMLLYLEEKNHKEISEIIGISETNVGTKINRIKKILLVKFQNSK